MSEIRSNRLNLLALPPLQRRIIVHLTREGPANAVTLAEVLGQELAEVEQALAALAGQEYLWLSADGRAEPSLGRTRRRTLPARLQAALLTSGRIYTAQEIVALRTALPFLQFTRAKLGEYVDHGAGHILRVKSFATQLGYILGLTPPERHLLRAAVLFHDVGNIVERPRHHIISQETVERLTTAGQLPFSPREGELIGLLCRWHRKEYNPDQQDELHGEMIRTGLLASILRVADAMDIDFRRSDYGPLLQQVVRFYYSDDNFWYTDAEKVLGVRLCCTPQVKLQLFKLEQTTVNQQINLLYTDLGETPLAWTIEEFVVNTPPAHVASCSGRSRPERALLAFPFEANSLVMAALSRWQLVAAGYTVQLLCYPNTVDSPAWLWGDALVETDPANFTRLVVINDRPDPASETNLFSVIDRWQEAQVQISLLNRHEANWLRLPQLLQRNVEVILGGDWVYFWGTQVSQADLTWARVAALCTRDPAQSTVGLTLVEEATMQGLLKVVYDAMARAADDPEDWAALADPLLKRIEANDRAYFVDQAASFATTYATLPYPGRLEGWVAYFEQQPDDLPHAYYWALEAAIESYGRTLERGISFKVPYAIATWADGQAVELLAINHWRDETATPIRLLYPADLGPPPEGNECTIQVRLAADQVEPVLRSLINACNQSQPQ
jgi:hypothetical protein